MIVWYHWLKVVPAVEHEDMPRVVGAFGRHLCDDVVAIKRIDNDEQIIQVSSDLEHVHGGVAVGDGEQLVKVGRQFD